RTGLRPRDRRSNSRIDRELGAHRLHSVVHRRNLVAVACDLRILEERVPAASAATVGRETDIPVRARWQGYSIARPTVCAGHSRVQAGGEVYAAICPLGERNSARPGGAGRYPVVVRAEK